MYVQVAESEDKEPIKLLTEEDGTLLLTTVLKQFPQCSGLIYKNPSTKALRWVQLSKDKLHPPPDVGWDSEIFYCVFAAENKSVKSTEVKLKCTNLKATMTKITLEKYFQSFGEVSAVTIKSDSKTGQSTGFVTIKFDSDGLKEKLMEQIHTIDEQVCFVKIDNFQSPKNAPGLGADYEMLIPAYFALLLNNDSRITNFVLRSNVQNFGNLDDLVIDVEINGEIYIFAFQLKHKENKNKKMSPSNFETNGDFCLKKYCEAFKTLKNQIAEAEFKKQVAEGENLELLKNRKNELKNYHFILYTNASLNLESKAKSTKYSVKAQDDVYFWNEIFNTSSNSNKCKNIYKIAPADGQPTNEGDGEFFSQFSFFASQKNVYGLKNSILKILRNKDAALKYINFFKEWHGGTFTDKILDKKVLNIHIVDIFLTPFSITNGCLTNFRNESFKLLEKAIKTFDVTIIDDPMENFLDELVQSNVPSDRNDEQLASLMKEYKMGCNVQELAHRPDEKMLRIAKVIKIADRFTKELETDAKLKISCYCFEKILFLNFNEKSENLIYTAMDLYRTREDGIKFVLVGRNIDVGRFSHLRVFRNLNDLKKENYYYDIIRTCNLSLQGRKNILLEQLVETFKDIGEFVQTKQIFQMLNGNYSIGGELGVLPQYYIHRTVSTTLLNLETILDHSEKKTEILVVNFDGKFDDCRSLIRNKNIQTANIQDYLKSERTIMNTIIITNEDLSKRQFSEICQKEEEFRRKSERRSFKNEDEVSMEIGQRNIHHLKMVEGNNFILVMSTNNTFFKVENSIISKTEEEIHDYFKNPINVLIAQPGMGKSTMLQCLTNKCPCDFWAVLVDLKAHNSFFQKKRSDREFVEYIFKLEEENKDVFLNKLKAAFLEKMRVAWFFDGLDEIENICITNVLSFVDVLSATGHRVWISSRQNLQEMLESHLNIFSVEMEEVSEEQQKQYVENRLRSQYKTHEVKEIISKLFDSTYITQNTYRLGVPLQLYIITQIFLDDKQHYERLGENNILILTKMYKFFCEGRYKHETDKCESKNPYLIPFVLEEQLENYQIAALHALFDQTILEKLKLELLLERNRKFLAQKDPLGIIVKVNNEGEAVFVHLTFLEYFACIFLTKNLHKARILKQEIFSQRYKNVLLMFNTMICEDSPLHLAVIHNDINYIEEHVNNNDASRIDEGSPSLLYLIACNGARHPELEQSSNFSVSRNQMLFKGENPAVKKTIEHILGLESNPFEKDTLFEWDGLECAFACGSLYIIEKILTKFGRPACFNDLLQKYYNDVSVAFYSLKFGYPKLLSAIFDRKFSVHKRSLFIDDFYIPSPLHLAVMSECANQMEIVNILISESETDHTFLNWIKKIFITSQKENIDLRAEGYTLLHAAVMENNYTITDFLLSKGANVNYKTDSKLTPLHLAAREGNIEIINLLLRKGANINITSDKANALWWAVQRQHYESVNLLINNGAKCSQETLCIAAAGGNIEIIKLLLSKGLKINGRNAEGAIPLHYAVASNSIDVLNFFLKTTIDVNVRANLGKTILHYAFTFSKTTETIKFLLNKDEILPLLNVTDNKGRTPLHMAVLFCSIDTIKVLFEKQPDVKVKTKDGKTILHYAFKRYNFDSEIIEFLLKKTDVASMLNMADKKGLTPLHKRIYKGCPEAVQLILNHEMDLDSIDVYNKKYPLYFALKHGHLDKELLLKMVNFISEESYYYSSKHKIRRLKRSSIFADTSN